MTNEIKNTIGFELNDVTTLIQLPHTNWELTCLLYRTSRKRNEVIHALRHPDDYLDTLKQLLSIVSYIYSDIIHFADTHNIKILSIPSAKKVSLQEAEVYVFHNFSCEEINMISNCYFFTKGKDIKIFNIDLEILHSANILAVMKQDLLVTIIRFKNYLSKFPTSVSRNCYIQNHFINLEYD